MKWRNATEEELRSHVANVITGDTTLSQEKVAKEARINKGQFNQWLNEKYCGDVPGLMRKITTWLDWRQQRQQAAITMAADPGFVPTPTSTRIESILTYAHLAADFTIVYGGAGVGKTKTCENYRDTANNVWLATMLPDCNTVAATLMEICEALGIRNDKNIASHALRREIRNRIKGTTGLLIIDESQHLPNVCLEEIRSIHDATGLGVVLVGNETVYTRITGGSRAAHFAQLFSRIGKRLRLNRPVAEDVHVLADAYGIEGATERTLLGAIAEKPGALRGMVKTIRLATMLATGAGVSINAEYIRAACRDLEGE